MANGKAIAAFPYKMLVVPNIEFTYNNSQDSEMKSIATITNNVVNSNNIIAAFGTGAGGQLLFVLSSNKSQIGAWITSKFTGTIKASILFVYS